MISETIQVLIRPTPGSDTVAVACPACGWDIVAMVPGTERRRRNMLGEEEIFEAGDTAQCQACGRLLELVPAEEE